MAGRALSQTVRVDAWLWSIRLFPTRSAATAACKAGHVRVNGSSAKPAHLVRVADTIRARTIAGERTVIVVALVDKRTSAALAVLNYDERPPHRSLATSGKHPSFATEGQDDRRNVIVAASSNFVAEPEASLDAPAPARRTRRPRRPRRRRSSPHHQTRSLQTNLSARSAR